MLVQRGTLRVGDALVSGEAHGKVKAMADFRGRPLKEAGPSMPVQILGFNTVPTAGDFAEAVKDERIARQKAETRSARLRMEQMAKARAAATSLDDFFQRLKEGAVKELALVLKGDVAGSVEALEEALLGITHPEVKVEIVFAGVGGINESDIMLASASKAVVIGFNVRPSTAAKALAEQEQVDVRTYRVIYKAIEDVEGGFGRCWSPNTWRARSDLPRCGSCSGLPRSGLSPGATFSRASSSATPGARGARRQHRARGRHRIAAALQ